VSGVELRTRTVRAMVMEWEQVDDVDDDDEEGTSSVDDELLLDAVDLARERALVRTALEDAVRLEAMIGEPSF
jgi:hypothetical protein